MPLTNGWWYLAVSNASGGLVDYTIMVSELVASTNTPPVLSTNLPNLTLDELTMLTVTNTATDANTNLTLTYTVTMSIDTNAMIINGWPLTYVTTNPPPVISTNGIITWTPSEAQGPGVYVITTVVTDNGLPPLSATNSFTVTVNEVNTAPFWPPNVPSQTNYIIAVLTTLVVTNTATDLDIPPNPLTYQLFGPPGAVIDHQWHHHLDADPGAGARLLHLHDDCDGYQQLSLSTRSLERDECLHRYRVRCGRAFRVHATRHLGHGNQRSIERHGHAQWPANHGLVPMGNEHALWKPDAAGQCRQRPSMWFIRPARSAV